MRALALALVLAAGRADAQEGALVDDAATAAALALGELEGARARPERAEVARRLGVACLDKVQAALGAGVPPSTIIEVPALHRPKLPLDEVAQKICQPALQVTYRAVMAALRDDKAALYRDSWRDLPVRGRGGKPLVTPAELARADRWCAASVAPGSWQVLCFRWKGHKQAGPPTTRSGRGDRPPPSAY